MVLGGEPARRRLGRATAAQRLGFRQYSREDSEQAQQARFESSRDHRTRTDRSPAIGLRSCSSGSVRQAVLLSPITGERSVLARWSREDSKRARRARFESSRKDIREVSRKQGSGLCLQRGELELIRELPLPLSFPPSYRPRGVTCRSLVLLRQMFHCLPYVSALSPCLRQGNR